MPVADRPSPAAPNARDAVVLALLVVVVHGRALAGEFVYDDALNIVGDPALRTGDLVALVSEPFFREHLQYWRPVTSLLLWLGYQGGIAGVHALALVAHVLATLAAHRLADRLLGARFLAVLAAGVFALHPLQVEGVAWASALVAPVCAVATLQTVLAALAWADGRAGAWRVTAGWALAAALTWEFGLLALPLAAAVVAAQPMRARGWSWRWFGAVGVGVVGAWLGLRALVFAGVAAPVAPAAGASGVDATLELLVRPLAALVTPWSASPFTPMWSEVEPPSVATRGGLALALAAAVAAGAWAARRDRRTVAVIAFVALPLLLPVGARERLGEFPLADRYLGLPAFGLGLAVGRCALAARARWLGVALLGACGLSAGLRVGVWRDDVAIVRHAQAVAAEHPTVAILLGNRAITDYQRGDRGALQRARVAFADASRRLERWPHPAPERVAAAAIGTAWCSLFTQQELGDVGGAPAAQFRAALALDDRQAAGWVGLGVALALAGRFDEALSALQRATAVDPILAVAWFNLGNLQVDRGDLAAARAALREALRWDPRLIAAADLLATLR